MVGGAPLACGDVEGFGTEEAFFGLRRPERLGHERGTPGFAVGDGHGLGHVSQSAPERGLGICPVWQAGVSCRALAERLGDVLCGHGSVPVVVQLGRY